MFKAISFFILFFVGIGNSQAFPEAPFDALKSNVIPFTSLESSNYSFEGIVKLSNCSGSIIRFKGQNLEDNAIVLTNAHCLGRPFLRPGKIITKKRVRRRMRVADKNMRFHRITTKELMYASLSGVDTAIYKLKETYRDLERLGIEAFELSDVRPYQGMDIEIVSGYWERGYTCMIDDFVYKLKEDSWDFYDSIRYTNPGCNTIGGTSGSPIILKGTKTVIGVNNTANESGRKCRMNNPCEVDENGGITAIKGASYGQQTYIIYGCLTSTFEIDVNKIGCMLPRG